MPSYVNLLPGDPAPTFRQRTLSNPRYAFDTAAGRHLVLFFFGSAARPEAQRALAAFHALDTLFDDHHAAFFGVSNDPRDAEEKRVRPRVPGIRYLWDFDGRVAGLYGLGEPAALAAAPQALQPVAFVISPSLQLLARVDAADPADIAAQAAAVLQQARTSPPDACAPILIVPGVFDRDFCRALIGLYDRQGGEDSGFMRELGGRTVGILDYRHKRRRDCNIEDESVQRTIRESVHRRLAPMILRAFQFNATRIERFIVACYDASERGHFAAHRDNTTRGTAHRRFAVTINLNAEDYDGGNLRFPEFGRQIYRAPTGGAVVFSCSLLHEATTVTRGRRYACLPFLYDDAAAAIREANRQFIDVPPQTALTA
jgi:peroxiredoxin/predicted 2-oxoglutarate/Fe(II)-dependent dioxygenase YbiX